MSEAKSLGAKQVTKRVSGGGSVETDPVESYSPIRSRAAATTSGSVIVASA